MGIGSFISGLFGKKDDSVTLTGDQATIVQKVLQKELSEIDIKRYHIVDKASKEGQMLPIDSMRRGLDGASQEVLDAAEIQIQDMFDKYGAEMPANTAQRYVREIDGESIWSDHPGCFE
jgi:hypothetical protein